MLLCSIDARFITSKQNIRSSGKSRKTLRDFFGSLFDTEALYFYCNFLRHRSSCHYRSAALRVHTSFFSRLFSRLLWSYLWIYFSFDLLWYDRKTRKPPVVNTAIFFVDWVFYTSIIFFLRTSFPYLDGWCSVRCEEVHGYFPPAYSDWRLPYSFWGRIFSLAGLWIRPASCYWFLLLFFWFNFFNKRGLKIMPIKENLARFGNYAVWLKFFSGSFLSFAAALLSLLPLKELPYLGILGPTWKAICPKRWCQYRDGSLLFWKVIINSRAMGLVELGWDWHHPDFSVAVSIEFFFRQHVDQGLHYFYWFVWCWLWEAYKHLRCGFYLFKTFMTFFRTSSSINYFL